MLIGGGRGFVVFVVILGVGGVLGGKGMFLGGGGGGGILFG